MPGKAGAAGKSTGKSAGRMAGGSSRASARSKARQSGAGAVKPELRISEEFVYGLADIYSETALEKIRSTLRLLENAPLMGTTLVRSSLARRYGGTIRILPVLTLSIVYRYDAAAHAIDVLALIYGTAQ